MSKGDSPVQLEICCPICRHTFHHAGDAHACTVECPAPECRAAFQYLGHCHLFLDIYAQAAELAEKGYRAAALVLAFTCYELYLEWFLVRKLQHDGWPARAIARLMKRQWQVSQRSGPVFCQVFGVGLADAVARGGGDPLHVRTVSRMRTHRNRVVHRGAGVTPLECSAALTAIYEVYSGLVGYAAGAGLLTAP